MKNRDLVSSIIWMALGGLFVAGALQQGLMRRGVPGPGFLPFFSGVSLIFVSLFVFIPALTGGKKPESGSFFPERESPKKIFLALVVLLAFGIAMEFAGFLLTTFLFMFFAARLMEPKRWRTTTLLAFFTAILSYLIFVILLEVQLPKGLLGI